MKALITGISGQDGTYLRQHLLGNGHSVVGIDRRGLNGLKGDITDPVTVANIVRDVEPDWVFNLAAQTFVGSSWQEPRLYMETNLNGVLNILEAVKQYAPKAHVVQASTSEMFGKGQRYPLNEDSTLAPASPYAVSKVAAHHLCRVYRESYGLHISCAISFNHESPIRPVQFVTRKVTRAAARKEPVTLGNLDSSRDWGFAGDYVQAYARMAEMISPDDYVIGTGETHTVAELCEAAYGDDWKDYVTVSRMEMRPNDVDWLCADSAKAQMKLGWKAETSFRDLIGMMVEADREKIYA